MPGENLPSELKVNLWMPLDIGPFLQDTAHLSAEEIGAYTLLLLYYWAHGPLPNDPKRLANIAKMSVDTWSITFVSLSMFFFVGSDGLLHQKGADRRRAIWLDKRLKAREKAIKAITARWSKYKAKQNTPSSTPSIPQVVPGEILENYPTSEVQEQKQKIPALLPPAARPPVGLKRPSPRRLGTSPRQVGKSPRQLGTSPRQLGISPRQVESARKAKPSETATVARLNGPIDEKAQTGQTNRLAADTTRTPGHPENFPNPSKPDPRKKAFAGQLERFWEGQNPELPKLRFNRAGNRALKIFLEENPDVTLELFQELLKNRARSDVNPAAPIYQWLRDLLKFAPGPLDKLGKPLSRSRVI